MQKLLVATSSVGKLKEIQSLLKGLAFEIQSLAHLSLPVGFDIEEPAATLEGNAIIKAMTVGKRTNFLTLGDDSGLEVEALDGMPGVRSKRFAPGTDANRNEVLLNLMQGKKIRTARFRTFIAVYNPSNDFIRICEGVCEGTITTTPQGDQGFGYDPIFFCNTLGKTLAQATLEEKNRVSHRGKALSSVRELLLEMCS